MTLKISSDSIYKYFCLRKKSILEESPLAVLERVFTESSESLLESPVCHPHCGSMYSGGSYKWIATSDPVASLISALMSEFSNICLIRAWKASVVHLKPCWISSFLSSFCGKLLSSSLGQTWWEWLTLEKQTNTCLSTEPKRHWRYFLNFLKLALKSDGWSKHRKRTIATL